MKFGTHAPSILSGRLLARNALCNFAGMAAPLLVAVCVMPYLINAIGKERFGLLTLIWMGIGYFGLFDMGLGQALTKLVAANLGREEPELLHGLIWTALWLIFGLGVIAMVVVLALSPSLIAHVLNVPEQLQRESLWAFRILAFGLPVVTVTTAFVGILEAHQQFTRIAGIRAVLGAMTFLAPVITFQVTPSLVFATGALLAVRLAALAFYFVLASKSRPELLSPRYLKRSWLSPLFSFGGWLTLDNIVNPIMVYFDRFFIGSLLTLAAVTYYVTPYEVLSRSSIFPAAVMGVLFPAVASAYATDKARMVHLYSQASRALLLIMSPFVVAIFLFAPEGLNFWLGKDFMYTSATVVHWLAAGVIINTIGRAPSVVLLGTGRPDLIAKLHLIELIPYISLLWILTKNYGIVGTAAAWTLRITADTTLLLFLVRKTLPELRSEISRMLVTIPAVALALCLAVKIDILVARALILSIVWITCFALLFKNIKKLTYKQEILSEPSS